MRSLSRVAKSMAGLLVSVMLFSSLPGSAEQATSVKKYPKIGLVLEGGGALGLAHIGVLLWLEEHHIPASYVAGTSMGGLVGGFYATGLSATEVREKVSTIDWNAVLAGRIPFQDLAFRRKEDAVAYPSTLEFGLRNGLRFPEAFNSGQQVSFILDEVALPYSDMKSFDDLPTPFGCVATDLVANRTRIFRSGSLAVALRATMSVPGIFTPVRTENQILADGGLLDNLPVDVAKDMGAELTLAIHLETAPLKPDAQLSLFGVLARSISTVVASNELRSMEMADIVVSVPLDAFSSTDYNRADEIIKAGYDAAANKATVLSTLAVDDATWQQYLANREARQRSAPIPEFVAVTGTGPRLTRDIEHQMAEVEGSPVDAAKMQERILYLQGLGRFNNLSYQMTERNGQPGLLILAEERQPASPIVRPLLLVDGSDFLNPTFNLGARITFLDVGDFRSEWRNDVIVGSQYGITSEYYHPVHPDSNWFVAPQAYANNSNFPVYDQNTLIANYRQGIVGGGGDIGYIFRRTAELRFGYQIGNKSLRRRIGNADLPNVSGRFGFTRLQFQLDTQNSNTIATSGNALLFRTDYFDANPGALHGFPLSEVASLNNFPLNHLTSAYLNAFGGTTYGHNAGIPPFSLGGTVRLAAWGTNALLTNQYFLFQTGVLRQLAQLPPFLGGGLFFNARFEVGKVYGIPNLPTVQGDVVGAFEVNTIFGPIMFGGAVGNAGHQKFFFRIGRLF